MSVVCESHRPGTLTNQPKHELSTKTPMLDQNTFLTNMGVRPIFGISDFGVGGLAPAKVPSARSWPSQRGSKPSFI